jgi:hypothetical protein
MVEYSRHVSLRKGAYNSSMPNDKMQGALFD